MHGPTGRALTLVWGAVGPYGGCTTPLRPRAPISSKAGFRGRSAHGQPRVLSRDVEWRGRRLDHPPTRGQAMGLGARDEGPTGAIVKATTVIYLRAAETAASNRTHSRRGTATTGAEAGDRVTTSPRAAPPASARANFFGVFCWLASPQHSSDACSAARKSSALRQRMIVRVFYGFNSVVG